jgi:anti-anti-sigma regulatory factor
MLFANQYSKTQVVYPGNEITTQDLRAFRAQVGLALAASDVVTLDLTRTERIDSWSLLAIVDLADKFAPRLRFKTSEHVRRSLLRIEPAANFG